MGYPDYKRDLLDTEIDVNFILDRYFHSGQSHVFSGAPPEEEPNLKYEIARALHQAFQIRIHPFQLVVCGSAHLGFSPVPAKLGTPFNSERSDVDVAVVSPELFESWWTELQTSSLDADVRQLVSNDLFWGFFNPANLQDSEHGEKWWSLFGRLRTDRAAGVRGRLYKNFWSMQSYHRLAILGGRAKLQREAR